MWTERDSKTLTPPFPLPQNFLPNGEGGSVQISDTIPMKRTTWHSDDQPPKSHTPPQRSVSESPTAQGVLQRYKCIWWRCESTQTLSCTMSPFSYPKPRSFWTQTQNGFNSLESLGVTSEKGVIYKLLQLDSWPVTRS